MLAVIHHLDHRRLGIGGDQHQIQSLSLRLAQGVFPRNDANLPAIRTDETHLVGANVLVQYGTRRLRLPS